MPPFWRAFVELNGAVVLSVTAPLVVVLGAVAKTLTLLDGEPVHPHDNLRVTIERL